MSLVGLKYDFNCLDVLKVVVRLPGGRVPFSTLQLENIISIQLTKEDHQQATIDLVIANQDNPELRRFVLEKDDRWKEISI